MKRTGDAVAPRFHSEDDVKIHFLVPFLEERGYKQPCIAFNVPIEVQEGRKKKTIFADAVVYTSPAHKAPLLVCETKAPSEVLDRSAREQAISYARLLPRIAPLALITNGAQVQVFHALNKSRLPELPTRDELEDDIVKFVIDKHVQETLRQEAKHDLFIIDDVRTFKSILKSCHDEIRNNEGLDPTAAFDEMSKVMFCKLYEEKENSQRNRFRLSIFDDTMERLKINVVRKIFDEARKAPAYAGLFQADAEIKLKDRTVRKIVSLFESYDLGLTAFDVKGEAFEYFLGDTFTGGLGEYFTPRNIVEFMVEAIDPKIGERIIDPFCGTGGFMIYAFEIVSEKIRLQEFSEAEKKRWRLELSARSLFGTDWKERTSQACKMNMMIHGDGSSGVFMQDGFADRPGVIEEGQFDICLTNPPFGSYETDPDTLKRYELGAGRKSQDRAALALERALRLVRPGGTVGIVIIDGILNTMSTGYVRAYLRRHAWVEGVVSLNAETFQGYGARAKTSILFLRKKEAPDEGAQRPVFMAIARNTGLAPNGAFIPGNVLPDILLDYRAFRDGAKEIGRHSESWIAVPTDRLDAEAYAEAPVAEVADIDSMQREVKETQGKLASSYKALAKADAVFATLDAEPIRLGDLLEEVNEPEHVAADEIYRLLGVRWWGEGAFIREEKRGRQVKAKTLHRVSAGWIIYNRLFAFRGSFAIVDPLQDGCHASGEFPTFVVREGVKDAAILSRYIVHCLNSPQYLKTIDAQSTGSTKTSRNRFNQSLFLDLVIEKPRSAADLRRVVDLLDEATSIRTNQARLLDVAKSLRDGVMGMLPRPVKFATPSAPTVNGTPRKRGPRKTAPEVLALFDLGPAKPRKKKPK